MFERKTIRKTILALVALVAALALAGCSQNQSPVAEAGAAQQVTTSSTVTLDASGSSDPNGDSLSYSWSVVGGPSVGLSSPAAAQPTFTAPDEPVAIVFELSVSDGAGGSSTDTTEITVVPPVTLFIANYDSDSVLGFEDPSSLNGNVAPDHVLLGSEVQLDWPLDLILDKDYDLMVANWGAASITGYGYALKANGNLSPQRSVTGSSVPFTQPTGLALHRESDTLFISDNGTDEIYVYNDASTSSFDGNIAADATLFTNAATPALDSPFALHLGSGDDLYVANDGGGQILVYEDAGTLNGDVAADRIITSGAISSLRDIHIDSNGALLVLDDVTNELYVFENASSLNGSLTPERTLTVSGASVVSGITVDSEGTGYVTDEGTNSLYVYENIASLSGTESPDRTISGAQTQFSTPTRLYLVEP